MKRCIHCKEEKPKNEFNSSHSCKDGLTTACKSCLRTQRKKRELKNTVSVQKKTCVRCNLIKTAGSFVHNKSSKDGLNGWCKACTKDVILNKKYGITLNEYEVMLKAQNSRCAICDTPNPLGPTNEFVVDHCHKTGKIRGLLCNHCNTGLGKLGDSVETLEKALRYLKSIV